MQDWHGLKGMAGKTAAVLYKLIAGGKYEYYEQLMYVFYWAGMEADIIRRGDAAKTASAICR